MTAQVVTEAGAGANAGEQNSLPHDAHGWEAGQDQAILGWPLLQNRPDLSLSGQGHARRLAARLMDLQLAAADSVGLATDTDAIVNTQEWMLYQLRLLDDQIKQQPDRRGDYSTRIGP